MTCIACSSDTSANTAGLCPGCSAGRRAAEGARPKPACPSCLDTHRMALGERIVPCTQCPVPCPECRRDTTPYCAKAPCRCKCHHLERVDPLECGHGQLSRSCELCEAAATIDGLTVERDAMRVRIAGLEMQTTNHLKLLRRAYRGRNSSMTESLADDIYVACRAALSKVKP